MVKDGGKLALAFCVGLCIGALWLNVSATASCDAAPLVKDQVSSIERQNQELQVAQEELLVVARVLQEQQQQRRHRGGIGVQSAPDTLSSNTESSSTSSQSQLVGTSLVTASKAHEITSTGDKAERDSTGLGVHGGSAAGRASGHKWFIDAGTNDGGSVEEFLYAFDPAFQDEAIRPFAAWVRKQGLRASDFTVYGFEGNPTFVDKLQAVQRTARSAGLNVTIFDTTVASFYLDTSSDAKWTLTYTPDLSFYIQGLPGPILTKTKKHQKLVEATAVSLSRFIGERVSPGDYVLLKMDVEGAEHCIMRHMALQGTLCLVDDILMEVHPYKSLCKPPDLSSKSATGGALWNIMKWLLESPGCKTNIVRFNTPT
eukprot:gene1878-2959_t